MADHLDVLVCREDEKTKRTFWTRIGVAFPAKSGEGYSILLDALPIGNKLILRPPREKREPGADDDKGGW